jgi:hypothetical protein
MRGAVFAFTGKLQWLSASVKSKVEAKKKIVLKSKILPSISII